MAIMFCLSFTVIVPQHHLSHPSAKTFGVRYHIACCIERPCAAQHFSLSGMTPGRVSRIRLLLVCWSLWACRSNADSILIKGGTLVNADVAQVGDILVTDGVIEAVGPGLKGNSKTRVIDAKGKYVMPGGIDPHTHLDAPMMGTISIDDFASGQGAALAGGTTMIVDFALPISGDIVKGFKRYQEVSKRAVMDYGFHMAITDWNDKVSSDMEKLTKEGINSFKFFLAYKGAMAVTDQQLLSGLRRSKELGALPMIHCENAEALVDAQQRAFDQGFTGPEGHYISRPPVLEDEGTARALYLAQYVNTPVYIVHVMSKGAAGEIAAAKLRGQRVVGETIASGIAAEEKRIWDPDFKVAAAFVMSPPIRNKMHQDGLKAALVGGVLDIIATDHCPFNSTQKRMGVHDFRVIPNGVNGIEERMHMVWDTLVNPGIITPSDFVRLTSTSVAKAFNAYPRKGALAAGSDADIIIMDPSVKHTISASTHHSRIDTNIYEGREVTGKVVVTISQGKVVWENDKLNVKEGAGRFIKLPTGGELFAGLAEQDAAAIAEAFPYGVPGQPVKRDLRELGSKDEL